MTSFAHTQAGHHRHVENPEATSGWHAAANLISYGFTRLFDSIYRSRQRQAERQIEHFFADRPNLRMTDAQERALSNRLMGGSGMGGR